MSTGATPAASAQAFQRSYAASLGIEPSELVPQDLKHGKAVATSSPEGNGLMYDQPNGQPRFRLYRAGQTKNGIRVYGAHLLALVRNAADYPVVWSSSTLRDLSGFVAPAGMQARAPDRDKSLSSIPGTTDYRGKPLPLPKSIASLSTPELVVFAGINGNDVEPRMAIVYTATTAPSGRWHFVADARTGEVLSVDSLATYGSITGTVTGKVTPGHQAMECSDQLTSAAFPYAVVNSSESENSFTDADGAYVLAGDFSNPVSVGSPIAGRYFNVFSFDPNTPDEELWKTVNPPATADFVHNTGGDNQSLTAQANAYVHVNLIRSWVLKYVPDYPGVFDQENIAVNVNLSPPNDFDTGCPGNAQYLWKNGLMTIDLCQAGTNQYNGMTFASTAFAGIIEHEYGHHLVAMVTSEDKMGQGPYGEGIGDTLEALRSGDPGHALGIYLNKCARPERNAFNRCQYLKDDACSDCGAASHEWGQLLSGTIWDIRTNLQATNPTNYENLINHLTLSSIHLNPTYQPISSDLAIDFLSLDDDDGNLLNGTPHSTEICSAFALHGMTCPPLKLTVTPLTPSSAEGPVGGPFPSDNLETYLVANSGPFPNTIQFQVSASPPAPWLTIEINGSTSLDCADAGSDAARCTPETALVGVGINDAVADGLAKGTYDTVLQFTNLTDHVGDTTRAVHLAVGLVPIYTETFEGGLGSFSAGAGGETTGLWDVTATCLAESGGHSGPTSLHFGVETDGDCTYSTGDAVAGTATTAPITITDTSFVKLRFNYFLHPEFTPSYDKASLLVSVNGGAFALVASNDRILGGLPLSSGPCLDGICNWHAVDYDLTPYLVGLSSPKVRVRFAFDSVDALRNETFGFLVDDIQILTFPNVAPAVEAGPDQTIVQPAAATLAGTVTDDGFPKPPGAVTITWSKDSGPGTVTFTNPHAASTTATFSAQGTYFLKLTGNDGALSTSDTVKVTVNPPPNQAPAVYAGPDLTVLLTPAASLAGTVSDDGLPNPPGKVTISWTKVSGPGTVTFANAKVAATTATFSKLGTYVVRLTANDSALSAFDEATVTVTTNKAPVMNAGPDQTVALSVPTSLAGTASDDGLPNPPGKVTVTWSKYSGPGTATFANKNALSTTATFSVVGSYVLRLTGNDGALSGTDDVAITVSTPCASLCSNPTKFTINGTYQSGELGTGAVCRETTSVLTGGNCGNFVNPRVLKVNGTTEPCTGANWTSVPAKRNGGYCIQTTTGQYSYAYFTAW